MGTTAEKLTYLNDTKGLLKDNINLTGAGLTNQTPFRQYATDLKTALLNILNNGIDTLYNNFPKTTGTGTNISLNNTLQAPMRSVINGDTEQDGEPTPSTPVEIQSVTGLQKVSVEGKNLFDKSSTPNFVDNGCTYEILNTGIRAKLTANSDGVKYVRYVVMNLDGLENQKITAYAKVKPSNSQNARFTIGTCNSTGGNRNVLVQSAFVNTETSQAITGTVPSTLDSTNNYLYILLYGATESGIASGSYTDFENLMIVKGEYTTSTIGNYEPYQTPQEYEINLGKNLFDKDNANLIKSGFYISSTKIDTVTGGYLAYIPCKSNTTYTVSKVSSQRFIIATTNEIPVKNTLIYNKVQDNTATSLTTTTDSDSKYLCVFYYLSSADTLTEEEIRNSIQIEVGSQATTYSPYFTPIHLYEDDQIIGTPYNWSIKHVMGEVVLDGSETWNYQYTNGYNTDIENLKQTTGNNEQPYVICDYYTKGSANTVYQNDYGISQRPNYGAIIIKNKDMANATALKTWLSTHNTKVVYELAEPTTEPITNTELINQLNNFYNAKSYNGTTNISVEGDLPMILDVSAIIGDE